MNDTSVHVGVELGHPPTGDACTGAGEQGNQVLVIGGLVSLYFKLRGDD